MAYIPVTSSGANTGLQTVTWKYRTPLTSDTLSSSLHRLSDIGVYYGLDAVFQNQMSDGSLRSGFEVSPGHIVLNDTNNAAIAVSIHFADTFYVPLTPGAATSSYRYLVARYSHQAVDSNYASFGFLDAYPSTTDLDKYVILAEIYIDSQGSIVVDAKRKTYPRIYSNYQRLGQVNSLAIPSGQEQFVNTILPHTPEWTETGSANRLPEYITVGPVRLVSNRSNIAGGMISLPATSIQCSANGRTPGTYFIVVNADGNSFSLILYDNSPMSPDLYYLGVVTWSIGAFVTSANIVNFKGIETFENMAVADAGLHPGRLAKYTDQGTLQAARGSNANDVVIRADISSMGSGLSVPKLLLSEDDPELIWRTKYTPIDFSAGIPKAGLSAGCTYVVAGDISLHNPIPITTFDPTNPSVSQTVVYYPGQHFRVGYVPAESTAPMLNNYIWVVDCDPLFSPSLVNSKFNIINNPDPPPPPFNTQQDPYTVLCSFNGDTAGSAAIVRETPLHQTNSWSMRVEGRVEMADKLASEIRVSVWGASYSETDPLLSRQNGGTLYIVSTGGTFSGTDGSVTFTFGDMLLLTHSEETAGDFNAHPAKYMVNLGRFPENGAYYVINSMYSFDIDTWTQGRLWWNNYKTSWSWPDPNTYPKEQPLLALCPFPDERATYEYKQYETNYDEGMWNRVVDDLLLMDGHTITLNADGAYEVSPDVRATINSVSKGYVASFLATGPGGFAEIQCVSFPELFVIDGIAEHCRLTVTFSTAISGNPSVVLYNASAYVRFLDTVRGINAVYQIVDEQMNSLKYYQLYQCIGGTNTGTVAVSELKLFLHLSPLPSAGSQGFAVFSTTGFLSTRRIIGDVSDGGGFTADHLAAGAVTAGKVAAGALNVGNEITTGALQYALSLLPSV